MPPMRGRSSRGGSQAETAPGRCSGSQQLASRAVRAVQIVNLDGPAEALSVVDLPDPEPTHMLSGDRAVVVDVHAAGVSFPEVLQTRGEYQVKPPLPFVPGSEVAGVVRSAPDGAQVKEGDRVAAFCVLGGFAEVATAPEFLTFPLSDDLSYAQGAGLILNYHTAWFSLVMRGRLVEGETVLVHGAAGGVGTAAIQVAKGVGARTIAVVSSDEKEGVAREAGADEVVRSDADWKDQAKELSGGGVDVVLDPVGGDRFTDSLRSLGEGGRLVVVGFTGGLDPRGQGQSPPPQQHRGRGSRLGRLRDGQARHQPGGRGGGQPPGGRRGRAPDRGRELPARARRRGARPDRLARRDRQGRARRARPSSSRRLRARSARRRPSRPPRRAPGGAPGARPGASPRARR